MSAIFVCHPEERSDEGSLNRKPDKFQFIFSLFFALGKKFPKLFTLHLKKDRESGLFLCNQIQHAEDETDNGTQIDDRLQFLFHDLHTKSL